MCTAVADGRRFLCRNETTTASNNEQLNFIRLCKGHCKAENDYFKDQTFKDQTVDLRDSKLQEKDMKYLATFIASCPNKVWVEINLSNCSICDDHINMLSTELCKCNDVTIEVMQLNDNDVTGACSSSISEIIINCKVQKLWIKNNHFVGVNEQFYLMLTNPFTKLQQLHMSGVKLSHDGAVSLFKAIQQNNTLKELDVTDNNIGDDSCGALTTALQMNDCLTKLFLWKNPISYLGSVFIVKGLKDNSSLERLGLPYHSVKNETNITSLQKSCNEKRRHKCQVELQVHFM